MPTEEDPSLMAEAVRTVRRLAEIAKARLRERNFKMTYDESVIVWLIGQTNWKESLDPIRTLDGYWHQHIANVIEQMVLGERYTDADLLSIKSVDSPAGKSLQFQIDTTTKT